MSVVSSDCCHCGTGYGVLVEVDAWRIAGGDPPHLISRAPPRKRVRFMAGLHRMLAAFAGKWAARGG